MPRTSIEYGQHATVVDGQETRLVGDPTEIRLDELGGMNKAVDVPVHAFIIGQADPSWIAHIPRCPWCARRGTFST
ncbi:MAG: hypothetical protein QOE80_4090 [Actinomycetota bacterium]|jgi:hypothetical protein|nr:hypothetical protein [Actinomycetota bacterium]